MGHQNYFLVDHNAQEIYSSKHSLVKWFFFLNNRDILVKCFFYCGKNMGMFWPVASLINNPFEKCLLWWSAETQVFVKISVTVTTKFQLWNWINPYLDNVEYINKADINLTLIRKSTIPYRPVSGQWALQSCYCNFRTITV
jgi:hypothetical protein